MTDTPTIWSEEKERAEITKAEAEAMKAQAEAEEAKAKAELAKASARKAAAEAEEVEYSLWELSKHREAIESSDENNFVYRFDTPVNEKSVKMCIQKLSQWHRQNPGAPFEVVFSSPGGSIFDGMSLFDYIQTLREQGHYITTGAAGMAASMAGILLQAGDHRWIGEQSWILIHRASFGAFGSTYEIEDEVEFIKRVEERIISIFTKRSNLTAKKIQSNWNRKDWWLSADESLEYGLVDEVRGALSVPEEAVED